MIDNIAAPLPTPGVGPIASAPSSSAGSQNATPPDADSAGATTSFAATLQNRMQQAAAPQGGTRDATATSKTPTAKDIGALLALSADKSTTPANPVAMAALAAHENGESPADAALEAIAAKLGAKGKAKDDAPADAPAAKPDLNAPPLAPIALNVIATTPTPVVATAASTDVKGKPGDAATAPRSAAPDNDTAAIIAVAGDKNTPAAANSDKSKDGDFADLLKNNAAVANVGAHAAHVANVAVPVTRDVRTPVASPQWSNDVGNQVSWMVSRRESHADLVLNPPQLGRIEVSISLNGDQATANFVSPNADVRDALQGSLPRLREILADAGVFLGQANIGAESFRQNGNGAEKGTNSYGESISSASETLLGSSGRSVAQGPIGVMRGQGLVDLFA